MREFRYARAYNNFERTLSFPWFAELKSLQHQRDVGTNTFVRRETDAERTQFSLAFVGRASLLEKELTGRDALINDAFIC